MHKQTSVYHQMLGEICQEDGIKLTWLSSDWIAVMCRGNQEHKVLGYGKFDLNPAAASMAADDKYVTFDLLRQARVPVIQHAMLYQIDNQAPYVRGRNTPEYIAKFFDKHDQHIVIKPNLGQCGVGVTQITTLDQVPVALETVFRQSFSASLCPFYHIRHEYRVVMLDDEPRLIYQKNQQGDWRFNLSQGSSVSQVNDRSTLAKLIDLAHQAVRAMGLRFCSVDIIETEDNEFLIMEINSGVAIVHYLEYIPDDYEKVKSIYRDAIRKMFEL